MGGAEPPEDFVAIIPADSGGHLSVERRSMAQRRIWTVSRRPLLLIGLCLTSSLPATVRVPTVRIKEVGLKGTVFPHFPNDVVVEIASDTGVTGKLEAWLGEAAQGSPKEAAAMSGNRAAVRVSLKPGEQRTVHMLLPNEPWGQNCRYNVIQWRLKRDDGLLLASGDEPVRCDNTAPLDPPRVLLIGEKVPCKYSVSPAEAFADWWRYQPFPITLIADDDFAKLLPSQQEALFTAIVGGMKLVLYSPTGSPASNNLKEVIAPSSVVWSYGAFAIREAPYGNGTIRFTNLPLLQLLPRESDRPSPLFLFLTSPFPLSPSRSAFRGLEEGYAWYNPIRDPIPPNGRLWPVALANFVAFALIVPVWMASRPRAAFGRRALAVFAGIMVALPPFTYVVLAELRMGNLDAAMILLTERPDSPFTTRRVLIRRGGGGGTSDPALRVSVMPATAISVDRGRWETLEYGVGGSEITWTRSPGIGLKLEWLSPNLFELSLAGRGFTSSRVLWLQLESHEKGLPAWAEENVRLKGETLTGQLHARVGIRRAFLWTPKGSAAIPATRPGDTVRLDDLQLRVHGVLHADVLPARDAFELLVNDSFTWPGEDPAAASYLVSEEAEETDTEVRTETGETIRTRVVHVQRLSVARPETPSSIRLPAEPEGDAVKVFVPEFLLRKVIESGGSFEHRWNGGHETLKLSRDGVQGFHEFLLPQARVEGLFQVKLFISPGVRTQ
ncbi:MAG: hypothetical protein QXN56_03845 [Candidatus Hadarchaeum sp.]